MTDTDTDDLLKVGHLCQSSLCSVPLLRLTEDLDDLDDLDEKMVMQVLRALICSLFKLSPFPSLKPIR